MPVAGRTPLGKMINKVEGHSQVSKQNKPTSKFGIISSVFGGKYTFMIKLLEKDGRPVLPEIGPIRVEGTPESLAFTYGSPEDMVGLMVRIDYRGMSAKRGVATIIRNKLSASPGQDYEETQSANQLSVKGCAFAPPGPGI